MTHRVFQLARPLRVLAVLTLIVLGSHTRAHADEPKPSCGTENQLLAAKPTALLATRGDAKLVTDGTLAPEGTRWDAPFGILLEGTTSELVYDLQSPRKIGAALVQADANDTYQLEGSLDGEHFEPLVQVPNVVQSGHGLRLRRVTFPAREVRQLRLGGARGDGFFSISEFGVYCALPPPTAAERAAAAERGGPASSRPLPFALALLLLVGLTVSLLAHRAPDRPATSEPRSRVDLLLHGLFLLSGCAALIYEIVWFHLLRLVIGASALSVGLVLASFMGGMFLGSLWFSRLVPADRNPLRVYALLEIGIGVFGLAMPWVLPAVRSLYVGLFGYGTAGIALRALIAAVLLLPPTALMGATLPAVARRFGSGRRAGATLASLYAANTFGAVLGCVLSGFLLLAEFDVWIATLVAAALNMLVGGLALRSARLPAPPLRAAAPTGSSQDAAARSRRDALIYLAAGLSGLSALGAQVVWTRLLTLLFGATVYAFSIILAVFLAGLGLGGAFATYWLRRGGNARLGLLWSQVGLIATLPLSAYLLADVLPYSAPSTQTPTLALHLLDSLRALDVILPSAILWGMSFPFALAAVGSGHHDSARASGQVYAANTLGAIIGALASSFWTIPSFGTHFTAQALVAIAALGALALSFAAPERAQPAQRATRALLIVASGVFAAVATPGLSTTFLAHGRHIWSIDPADRYPYVSEGAAATVAVHIAPDGYQHFHVSGRVEASTNPADMRLQRLLGHLSALAHDAPSSVLVVGLGAGVTAGALAVHPEVKRIVICEIEPRVTGATERFSPQNYAILRDPRVQVVFDDARHYLATTRERFDVITSDPIHPWVRGNSVLFSREYYRIVLEHLKPGGIATQWVPLYDTNEQAIQIQMRTFSAAFRDATVWNSSLQNGGYDVVLLGRTEHKPLSIAAIQQRIDRNPKLLSSLRAVRIDNALDLLATYATDARDMREFMKDAPINEDFSLKLEYISGLALNQQRADVIYRQMVAKTQPPRELFTGPELSVLLARIARPIGELR